MPTRSQVVRHDFAGGWSTDLGPTTKIPARPVIGIPHLVEAQNVFYELDGGPHKIGGTEKINSTVIESGAVITGLYDYWKQGTTGSAARNRVLHAGTKIKADDNDGVFADIFTGLESGAVPNYATFDDLLIISSDSTVDVPKSWDQTTAQTLAGTPPNFAFSVKHQNRMFAAGNVASPSTLYYSVNVDPEDWAGAGSGTIQFDPDDGDVITGIASHKNELWVFKGPYKGSIHRLTGTSSSDFARTTFIEGLGAAWQNGIFRFKDDLGFVSQFGTVHSLAATAAFGDFNAAALSLPINKWIREHLNFSKLRQIWAVNDPLQGYILLAIPIDASTTNNEMLMMDYRFSPPRWAHWPAYQAGAAAYFQDSSNIKRVLIGGNDGFVRRTQVAARSIDGATAISAKVTTPFFDYGIPIQMKTISQASVGISPKGNFDGIFGWARDDNAQQTQTFTQGGGDVLGVAAVNQFTLGTSELAGGSFVDRFMELEEGGEFRSVQYEVTQTGLNEDIELHSISATIQGGAISTEN